MKDAVGRRERRCWWNTVCVMYSVKTTTVTVCLHFGFWKCHHTHHRTNSPNADGVEYQLTRIVPEPFSREKTKKISVNSEKETSFLLFLGYKQTPTCTQTDKFIHVNTNAHTHTQTHTNTPTCSQTHTQYMDTNLHAHTDICIYQRMQTHTHNNTCTHKHTHAKAHTLESPLQCNTQSS